MATFGKRQDAREERDESQPEQSRLRSQNRRCHKHGRGRFADGVDDVAVGGWRGSAIFNLRS
ncbi:uncharacterized protein K452DRAFT_292259 [Aplosporella prunicola CBS 121167]|uniref:Uncharacterized protein n=1 Tax=Aplosporella prunicola CBS 121167 TaxID=1176127 RepID=A0A6A6AYB4_9PEZI|nr:uncharacterized protein K452DRAFT_292259 [Aplosporella prunicola CBS 121167]KAF2136596.1 hypothetical protein K452DRAFT_292259 [Aplosporella prunicola CBS 121167]